MQKWLDAHLSEIERDVHAQDGELYFVNRPVAVKAELWRSASVAKIQGRTTVDVTGPTKRRIMISAINRQGTLRWAIVDGPFGEARQSKFVEGLMKDAVGKSKRPLLIIRNDLAALRGQNFLGRLKISNANVQILPEIDTAI